MDNMESLLDELTEYDKQGSANGDIPKSLEEYINHLAKTGNTVFPWPKVRGLIRRKLEVVIINFKEICPTENLPTCPNVEPFHYDTMRDKILEQFDSFTCAPFTIQRLCELLCFPRKHYKRIDKFMRGVEKNLLVVSTVDPEQRKWHDSLPQPLVNGAADEESPTTHQHTRPFTLAKDLGRPASAASDTASVSDADSGISDTEDEDKLVHKSRPSSSSSSSDDATGATEKVNGIDGSANIPPVMEVVPASATEVPQLAASSHDDEAKSAEIDVEAVTESDVVCPLPDAALADVVVGDGHGVDEEIRSRGDQEKKRPLEEDEEPQVDGPDAKHARIFSPDRSTSSVSAQAEQEPISSDPVTTAPPEEAESDRPSSRSDKDLISPVESSD